MLNAQLLMKALLEYFANSSGLIDIYKKDPIDFA